MKKLIVPLSFAVMALAVAAMLPALVSAQTTSDRIEGRACITFNSNMGVGTASGENVARLTAVLVREGFLTSRATVFDEDVAAAVVKFQAKYGIPTTGYVGPLTRAKLNSMGCANQGTSTSAFVCPTGYVCTPANQVSYTCPPGFTCTANTSTIQTTTNTSTNINGHQIDNIPGTTYGVYDVDVSTLAGLERRQAIRQLYLSLQHRDPDLQGLDYWVYMNADLQNIKDQMKAGIEYQTKQKIVQIFQDVYHRYPDDIELTKWYYTAEYFNYDTNKVRASLTGNTTVVTPVVTPVVTRPVYVPPTPVVPPVVATAPTATFTIEGQHAYTYNTGETNHYAWSSTNADRFSSSYTATGGTVCGGGPWVANTSSGISNTVISDAYAGCVWTVTYVATNSATGQSASDTVVVTVNPLTRTTTAASTERQ
jgi:hypothetical protein